MEYKLTTPLTDKDLEKLNAGDTVMITGTIYTGRDAAHKRVVDALDRGEESPFPLQGSIIYFVGPAPAKPGYAIGSAGPTTSYRMDPFSPRLISLGLKGMIGKGSRSEAVIDACVKHKAVYFGAVGGAGALISRCIKEAKVIAYDDLGPEAIRELKVENFPCVVVNDVKGNDLYRMGREKFRRD